MSHQRSQLTRRDEVGIRGWSRSMAPGRQEVMSAGLEQAQHSRQRG